MKIKKEEIFTVDSHQFRSEKEAQNFLAAREKSNQIILNNIYVLNSSEFTAVPVYIDGELDFFDNKALFESISLRGHGIRYIKQTLHILTPEQVVNILPVSDISLDSGVFEKFVDNLVFFNDVAGKDKMDWRQLCLIIGRIQIHAETIYLD